MDRHMVRRWLGLVLVGMLVFAACGDDDDAATTTAATTATTTGATTGETVPPSPGTLPPDIAGDADYRGDIKVVPFLTAESSPEAVSQITSIIEAFEAEHPDIAIELQLTSNDNRAARIINAAAVGDELGIFEIERRWVPDFVQAGWLLQLDDIVNDIGQEKFIPGSMLYWPWDGHLYQYTSDLSAASLFYRSDLFEDAGLAAPDSYERLLEASQALHGQGGVSGNAFEESNDGGVQRFATFMWQNCGDFYNADGSLAFDRAGSRTAVENYAELNQYTPEDSFSWGSRDPVNAYVAGRVAIALYPARLAFEVGTKAPDIAAVTEMVEPRVAGGGTGPQVVYGAVTSYAVGSTVKHPEAAMEFLKFIFTGDNMVTYALGVPGHVVPPVIEDQQALLAADDPYVQEYQDWMQLAVASTTYFNHEAQNMGSIQEDCTFEKSLVPMPWSSRVMGQTPVISELFQRISLEGQSVEDAYDWAVGEFRSRSEEWMAQNPWFTPVDPNWMDQYGIHIGGM